jgi:UDP-glucose 4-epimerase
LANHPSAVGEVFNLGNTQEITINELADLVKKMTGSKSEIIHIPYDRAYEKGFEDMPRRVPDISKIQRLIGYRPSLDLEEILERIIASIQNNERPELVPTQEAAS